MRENMATKTDVAEVRTELAEVKADISEVRVEVKADLAGLEVRLYRHLWVMAAGIVVTVTLVKLLA